MNKLSKASALILPFTLAAALSACKTGFNKTPSGNTENADAPACDSQAVNANTEDYANKVLALLSELTCQEQSDEEESTKSGVIMGQSLGDGNQIVDDDHPNSYANLMTRINDESNSTVDRRPALISIDYEHDKEYSLEELKEANVQLETHWNEHDAGLVSISWMPLNPWDDSETPSLIYSDEVDLSNLYDKSSADYLNLWKPRLDKIADALLDLQEKKVAVLWQPLPRMNSATEDYWWGTKAIDAEFADGASRSSGSAYIALWKDMYEYFTTEKKLNNLLWVYTTEVGTELPSNNEDIIGAPVDWAYPGTNYVDVVAGVSFHNQLLIPDYEEYLDFDKPLGMTAFGPALPGTSLPSSSSSSSSASSTLGDFDNSLYADRLNGSYEFIGFWISWHNLGVEGGTDYYTPAYLSLVDNPNFTPLVQDSKIITLHKMNTQNYRN